MAVTGVYTPISARPMGMCTSLHVTWHEKMWERSQKGPWDAALGGVSAASIYLERGKNIRRHQRANHRKIETLKLNYSACAHAFTSPPWDPSLPFSRATIFTAVSRSWRMCRARRSEDTPRPKRLQFLGTWGNQYVSTVSALNTQWSQLGKYTLLNHIQTGCQLALWQPDSCAAWAVGSNLAIRTGLKQFDHQPSPRSPSYRARASLRLHNLPLKDILVGRLRTRTRNLWELVKFVNGQPEIPLPTGWQAGRRRRQRAWQRKGQRGMPDFWSCDCGCLRVSCTVSMFEKIVQCLDERGCIVKAEILY